MSNTAEQAKPAATPCHGKAKSLIDSANNLLGEGKYQDALAERKEIGGEKPSLDRQNLVDSLKAQIEKSLAATPRAPTDARGVGGLFRE